MGEAKTSKFVSKNIIKTLRALPLVSHSAFIGGDGTVYEVLKFFVSFV